MIGMRFINGASPDYTPGVVANENNSLYTFLLDIKEINSELIDRHLDNSVHRKFLSICSRDVTTGLLSVLSVPPLGIFEFLGTKFSPPRGSKR
jgi:hypothetical protein